VSWAGQLWSDIRSGGGGGGGGGGALAAGLYDRPLTSIAIVHRVR